MGFYKNRDIRTSFRYPPTRDIDVPSSLLLASFNGSMHRPLAVSKLPSTALKQCLSSLQCLTNVRCTAVRCHQQVIRPGRHLPRRPHSTNTLTGTRAAADVSQFDHLDPAPPDYSSQPFVDACTISVGAGAGGHGCISFLREKFIANGPPNGGDGGTGGSVYIQAVREETSLHKIARRGALKAGRGRNGQGSMKRGARGEDVVLTVPVGTVVREIARQDPVDDEERLFREARRRKPKKQPEGEENEQSEEVEEEEEDTEGSRWQRDKWLIYPGYLPRSFSTAEIPPVPRPRRSTLAALQPRAPFRLDLDEPMETPMLLAAGAMGGLGNPHFITKALPKPKFALKGDGGMRVDLHLELKLLADVGLVGLPNAGKSTLLRAVTNSRTRVGNWAFTTLAPSIGTVVLDSHVGRPIVDNLPHLTPGGFHSTRKRELRTNFTIADIPGLIEGAHEDRGLGLGFLRHIERAAVLAFVIDLSGGDANNTGPRDSDSAVHALQGLWHEVSAYEQLRARETAREAQQAFLDEVGAGEGGHDAFATLPSTSSFYRSSVSNTTQVLPPIRLPPISSKPWLVIATKADLPGTEPVFARLQEYLAAVQDGTAPHPSGRQEGWREKVHSVPVAAINKEGVKGLPEIILSLLR